MKQILFQGRKNIIGEKLQTVRKEKGLSQSDLAAKMQTMNVNMDQQMISKIEKNQRQVTDFEFACFCKCLRITTEELLGDFNALLK